MRTKITGTEFIVDAGSTPETEAWVIGPAHAIIDWIDRPVPEGGVGLQPEEVLDIAAERLRHLNAALPSRETSLAITHVETAILWLRDRRRDREARGVEGTHQP